MELGCASVSLLMYMVCTYMRIEVYASHSIRDPSSRDALLCFDDTARTAADLVAD